ncbi:MAG: DUF937 domain-containing protein [Rubripirellula sp.]
MNILDLMKDQLAGAVVGQIGKKIGIDEGAANAGIGAMLPTILGGLMKQASSPSGAEALNNSLDSDDYDGGMLDNLPDLLSGGGDGGGLMGGLGKTVLTSLFGDKVASIAGILSKLTGMGSDKSTSMLALLAPLVMSFLGKQKRSMGLDAGGMTNLLMSQKDAVADSLPAGMSTALGLGDLGIQEKPAAPASRTSEQPAGEGVGMMKLLIPLILIGVIGYSGYKMLAPAGDAVKDAADAVANVDLPDVDMGNVIPDGAADMTAQLNDVFSQYGETLGSVRDEASATAALPKLEGFNDKLGGMSGMLSKLPEGARSAVGGQVSNLLAPIEGMLEKLYAIPGVKAILEPVLTGMLEKAKALIPA